MTDISYGEFWLPGGSDAHPDNPLSVCGLCSAIVLDYATHTRWHHTEQTSATASPLAWPWQCESCGADIFHDGKTWMHLMRPACDDLSPAFTAPDISKLTDHVESAEDHPTIDPAAPEHVDLAAVRARVQRAHTEVGEICQRTGAGRWRMSIPARPDRDSDLLISAALNDAELLANEVEQLRAQRDAAQRPNLVHEVKVFVDRLLQRRDAASASRALSGNAMAAVYDDHVTTLLSTLTDTALEQTLGERLAGVLDRWEMQLAWKSRETGEGEQAKAEAYRYSVNTVRTLLAELDRAEATL